MAAKNRRSKSARKGMAIGAQLISHLESKSQGPFSPFSVEVVHRKPGEPQDNIVLTYFDKVRGDREMEAGFAAILSDYVSSCAEGCVPNAAAYRSLISGARPVKRRLRLVQGGNAG